MFSTHLSSLLSRGGLAVIPTDTIYGIVAKALNRKAVERLYAFRRETAQKPFIVLISDITDLRVFGCKVTLVQEKFLKKVWPGKVSVVFPCKAKKFSYLHRNTGSLAFRLPRSSRLQALLKETGPLVAPSANFEGKTPARTIKEAKSYFGTHVDMYIGAKRAYVGKPSTLVSLLSGAPQVLREGAVTIEV